MLLDSQAVVNGDKVIREFALSMRIDLAGHVERVVCTVAVVNATISRQTVSTLYQSLPKRQLIDVYRNVITHGPPALP